MPKKEWTADEARFAKYQGIDDASGSDNEKLDGAHSDGKEDAKDSKFGEYGADIQSSKEQLDKMKEEMKKKESQAKKDEKNHGKKKGEKEKRRERRQKEKENVGNLDFDWWGEDESVSSTMPTFTPPFVEKKLKRPVKWHKLENCTETVYNDTGYPVFFWWHGKAGPLPEDLFGNETGAFEVLRPAESKSKLFPDIKLIVKVCVRYMSNGENLAIEVPDMTGIPIEQWPQMKSQCMDHVTSHLGRPIEVSEIVGRGILPPIDGDTWIATDDEIEKAWDKVERMRHLWEVSFTTEPPKKAKPVLTLDGVDNDGDPDDIDKYGRRIYAWQRQFEPAPTSTTRSLADLFDDERKANVSPEEREQIEREERKMKGELAIVGPGPQVQDAKPMSGALDSQLIGNYYNVGAAPQPASVGRYGAFQPKTDDMDVEEGPALPPTLFTVMQHCNLGECCCPGLFALAFFMIVQIVFKKFYNCKPVSFSSKVRKPLMPTRA